MSWKVIPCGKGVSTHTRIAWVELPIWILYDQEKLFVPIEILTSFYISAYFLDALWLCYQLIMHACSDTDLWEFDLYKIFLSFSDVLVWSVWTDLFLRSNESSLALCWPNNCTSGQDLYRFKTCFSFSAIHTSLHHVMLCVFLVDFSRDFGILCTSLLIPWSSLCLPLFF
jgi:hypothetical protein